MPSPRNRHSAFALQLLRLLPAALALGAATPATSFAFVYEHRSEICYLGGNQLAGQTLNGSATLNGTSTLVTPDATYQNGSVFLNTPLDPTMDIHLRFRLRISQGTCPAGADGLALVMQRSPSGPLALGTNLSLGYGGISPSVAVEFDTYQNASDPAAQHIAMTLNGDLNHGSLNNYNAPSLYELSSPLNDGRYFNVWLDYSPSAKQLGMDRPAKLSVYFAPAPSPAATAVKPSSPVQVSYIIGDLGFQFKKQPFYIGFTSSTRALCSQHEIREIVGYTTPFLDPYGHDLRGFWDSDSPCCFSDSDCVGNRFGPVCDPDRNTCGQCSRSNVSACTFGVCDTSGTANICDGPCNGNNGSGASYACPSAYAPYCVTSGPAAGSCFACNGNYGSGASYACGAGAPTCDANSGYCSYCASDAACGGLTCTNGLCQACNGNYQSGASRACTSAAPYCNAATGACGTQCNADSDCGAGNYCYVKNGASSCQPKLANGTALPTGETCSSIGTRACTSGACSTTDNKCGRIGSESCTSSSTCRSNSCSQNYCGAANGAGFCAPSTAVNACRSGVCGGDNKCGYANGEGSCSPATASTICRNGGCGSATKTCVGTQANACAGNADCPSITNCYQPTYTCRPTITITGDDKLFPGEQVNVSFVTSVPTKGFYGSDLVSQGGTTYGFQGNNAFFPTSSNYSVTFQESGSAGTTSVSVPAGALTDASGAPNLAATFSFSVDGVAPTMAFSANTSSLYGGQTIPVTLTFSEPPAGLTIGDLAATGGTLSNLVGSGTTYTVQLTQSGMANTTEISLAHGLYTDAAGNPGSGHQLAFNVDAVPPSVTITAAASELSAGQATTVTFSFSEAITNFGTADVSVLGGSLSAVVPTADPKVFEATFTQSGGAQPAITIATGSYNDVAGNPGLGNYLFIALTPLVLDASAGAATYPAYAPAVAIDPALSITGVLSIPAATVWISSGFVASEDRLFFTNQNGISGSYDAATGVLSLTGTATPPQYQAALRSVAYGNIANANTPTLSPRTISFALGSKPVNGHYYEVVSSSGNASAARIAAASRRYLGLQGYLATVGSAAENAAIATKLSGLAWMALKASPETSLPRVFSWNAGPENGAQVCNNIAAGTCTAIGGAYTGWNTGEPNNVNGGQGCGIFNANGTWDDAGCGSSLPGFVVEYGGTLGDPALVGVDTRVVNLTYDPLAITATGTTLSLDPGAGAQVVDPDVTIAGSAPNIAAAVVSISSGYVAAEDRLSLAAQNGITGAFNTATGELTLSGVASVASYQAALRSITYTNVGAPPTAGARTVTFQLGSKTHTNGHYYEVVATSGTHAAAETAAAARTYLGLKGYLATVGSSAENAFIATKLTGLAWMGLKAAPETTLPRVFSWMAGPESGTQVCDNTAAGTCTAIAGAYTGWNAGEPNNVNGGQGCGIFNANGTWDDAGCGSSLPGFVVEYGGRADDAAAVLSASRSMTIRVTPTNLATTVGTLVFDATSAAAVVDAGLTLTGSQQVSGATVAITSGYVSGQDVLGFTNANGITGSWEGAKGLLTLSGLSTSAAYQAALRTVTYNNTGGATPNTAQKTITFSVGGLTASTDGHHYDLVTAAGSTYAAAKAAAEARAYYGRKGYLATITSSAENALLAPRVSVNAWMGAKANTTSWTGRFWSWDSGPDAGLKICDNGSAGACVKTAVDGVLPYSNWSAGEPNNSSNNEACGMFLGTAGGVWNDGQCTGGVDAYLVEYGGSAGDPTNALAANKPLQVRAKTGIALATNGTPATVTNAVTFTATMTPSASTGSVQFVVDGANVGAPVTISSGTASYTTSSLAIGTHTVGATYAGDTERQPANSTLAGGQTIGGFGTNAGTCTQATAASICASGACSTTGKCMPAGGCLVNDDCSSQFCNSTTNVCDVAPGITLTSTAGDFNTFAGPQPVDANLVVVGTQNIPGATVAISEGYVPAEDALAFTNQSGLTGSWDAAKGVLTITGNVSSATLQAALRTVTYNNTAPLTPNTTQRKITFGLGTAKAYSGNGHFFEYVASANTSWTSARTAAESRRYLGLQGYLATITSAAENDFIVTKLSSDGWIGARANSTNWAGRYWYWATGPDLNTKICDNTSAGACVKTAVNGVTPYSNWHTPTNEPNNSSNIEDAGQIYFANGGTWNDLPVGSTLSGYVVEYGGLTTDPVLVATGTRNMNLTFVPTTITASSGTTTHDPAASPTPIDPNLTLIGNQTINGATITISSGYVSGQDVLGFTNQSGITGTWDASKAILTLTGNASTATYQAALRTVTYNNTQASPSNAPRSITFGVGSAVSYTNGHFYEYVASANTTWTNAKTAAEARTYLGLKGYLASITSAGENAFIVGKLSSDGWIGARANTTNWAGRYWYWATGPDLNVKICDNTSAGSCVKTAVGGVTPYSNWHTPTNEPNNSSNSEDAGQIYFANGGTWNDLPVGSTSLAGYVVEYGGWTGQDAAVTLSANKSLQPRGATTVALTPSAATIPVGASVTLTAAVSPPTATGTVQFSVDGTNVGSPAAVNSGVATYTTSTIDLGTHSVGATYSGDATNAPSSRTLTNALTVNGFANGAGSCTAASASSLCASGACSVTGRCMPAGGCLVGADCAAGSICDTATSACTTSASITVSTGAANYTAFGAAVAVDPSVTVTSASNITGATVSIGSGFVAAEDSLQFTTQNGITGTYDSTKGILTLSGEATAAQYQAALRSVTYSNSAEPTPTTTTREIVIGLGSLPVNPANGHFYEYVSAPATNAAARTQASAKSLLGLGGYVASLTSAGEAAFVRTKLAPAAAYWLGMSPVPTSTYPRTWQHSATPEAPSDICISTGSANCTAVNGAYMNWGSGQPTGLECALQGSGAAGTWSDANCTNAHASVVEYGGLATDPSITVFGKRNLSIAFTALDLAVASNGLTYESSSGAGTLVVDATTTLAGDQPLTGASVAITSGLVAAQDSLEFTPTANVTGAYNATTGVLSLTGTASASEYQTVLRSVTYRNSSTTPTGGERKLWFALGTRPVSPDGHFFEAMPALATWGNAATAATSRNYLGVQGYLATITSTAEAGFIAPHASPAGASWIGGQPVPDGVMPRDWTWVTGPENGTAFCTQTAAGVCTSIGGRHSDWEPGQPSDTTSGACLARAMDGKLSAVSCSTALPALVEYGGRPGDLRLAGSRSIYVRGASGVTIASSENPTVAGAGGTFTATVTPTNATGFVQFMVEGVPFGMPVAIVGGQATSQSFGSFPYGVYNFTAEYAGSGELLSSVSASLTQTISPIQNGFAACDAVNAADRCASGVCGADGRCGLANGEGSCDATNGSYTCRSGACGSDGSCGLLIGDATCTVATASSVCRSGACGAVSGLCVPEGGCGTTADCAASEACDATSHLCSIGVAITTSDSMIAAGEAVTITFTFSSAPIGFAADDLTTSGGTLAGLAVGGNANVYTATLTQSGNDALIVGVAAGSYLGANGVAGQGGTLSLTTDLTAPSLAITSADSLLAAGESVTVTFAFSEAPVGFDASDVTVTGGALGSLSSSGADTFTATFTQAGSATPSIEVAANTFADAAGNQNAQASVTMTSDIIAPSVSITSSDSLLALGESVSLTFTFSEEPVDFTQGDVTIAGGVLSGFGPTGDPKVYEALLLQLGTDAPAVSIANGTFFDAAGNAGTGGAAALQSDVNVPTLVITTSDTNLAAGEAITVTFTFSEEPSGFTTDDVTFAGGTLSGFAPTADLKVFTATFTQAGLDAPALSVADASYVDLAGNPGTGGTVALSSDTIAPSLAITSTDTNLASGESVSITITFSEPPVGFDASDVAVIGGTLSAVTAGANPSVFSATFTQSGGSSPSLSILDGLYTDAAGNVGTGGSLSLVSDLVAPTLAITASDVNLAKDEAITVTFTFSEPPVGFDATDVALAGGALTGFAAGGDTKVYTATFTQSGAVAAALSVANDLYADAAGNLGTGASLSLTSDVTAPTLAITASDTHLAAGEAITVTFTFSEAPVGFDASDVTIAGGTLTGLAAGNDAKVYTATFTQSGSDAPALSVSNDLYADAAGNNGAGASLALSSDTTAPTLAITATDTNLAAGEAVTVTFTFSETPVGFAASDVTIAGGTLTGLAAGNDAKVYTATFTQSGTDAPVLSVANDLYTDAAGNKGTGAAIALTSDIAAPTLVITASDMLLAAGEAVTVTFAFSEVPLGFDAGDISVTGGLLSSLAAGHDAKSYTATFTQTGSGTSSITVANGPYTDAAGNAGAGASLALISDLLAPTLTITTSDDLLARGEAVTLTFTFSEAPANFDASDVTTTGGRLTGLGVTNDGKVYTAGFTQEGSDTPSVVVAGGTYTDTAGNSGAEARLSMRINLSALTVVISAPDTLLSRDEATQVTFTFSDAPIGFDASDVAITGGTLTALATAADTLVYTATFTQAGSASPTLTIADGSYQDAAGNNGAGSSLPMRVDLEAPSLTITTSDDMLAKDETITVTFTFSEVPVGFDEQDVMTSGGTLTALTTADARIYTARFTQSGPDAATIAVGNDQYRDEAGNLGTGASHALSVDLVAPELTITATDTILSFEEAVKVTFTFTEPPMGFESGDVTIAGGTLTAFAVTADTKVFTATFTQSGGTAPALAVANAAFTDAAGNAGRGASLSMSFDLVAPTLAISASDTLLAQGESVLVSFTFSEVPSNLDFAGLTFAGGTLGAFESTTDPKVFTSTFTQAGDTLPFVAIAGDAYTDLAGNKGSGATLPFLSDIVAPTLEITASGTQLSKDEAVTVTLTFSEPPIGLHFGDVVATGGTLGGFTTKSDTVFEVTFTQSGSAAPSVSLANALYTDLAGNPGSGAELQMSSDVESPTVAIAASDLLLAQSESVTMTFTFSEIPSGFDDADLVVTGGILSPIAVSTTDAKVFTALFTQLGTDRASVSLADALYTDAAGNPGSGAALPLATDLVAPTLSITADGGTLQAGETITLTLTFSEVPFGFAKDDLQLTTGTLGDLTATADANVFTITHTQSGDVESTLTVAAASYTDEAGNRGTEATLDLVNDLDGDGLTDAQELVLATNPRSADSDGDGIPDAQEVALGTSPTNSDSDGDGMPDGAEVAAGLDPTTTDSDGDGISDALEDTDGDGLTNAQELALGTDAANADSDGDGLPDGLEVKLGLNPLQGSTDGTTPDGQVDTDGDGIPNAVELANGLDPATGADAALDPDGDGMTNREEAARGTDPHKVDTDGDGLSDGLEVKLGIDPLKADSDGDGLPDGQEDTDGDGLTNAQEVAAGMNPNDTTDAALDSDGDGIPNAQEIALGTDPYNADSDGDGLSDGVEVKLGLDPQSADSDGDGIPDGEVDSDQDGVSNVDELANGTDPNKSDSDGDGVEDKTDNCPLVANTDQLDTDGNGVGDACVEDVDGDGVKDAADNCRLVANADQGDLDQDVAGDACDPDVDGDGLPNVVEGPESLDTDQDGTPDFRDTDSDGDGIPDHVERLDDGLRPVDTDGDGTPDVRDSDSDGDTLTDAIEKGTDGEHPVDSDGDGQPDYRDIDSNDDGVADGVTGGTTDTDGDGTPDFQDVDKDNDGLKDDVIVIGSGCTQAGDVGSLMLFALALVMLRRRKEQAVGAALIIAALAMPAVAQVQEGGFNTERYSAPVDGLGILNAEWGAVPARSRLSLGGWLGGSTGSLQAVQIRDGVERGRGEIIGARAGGSLYGSYRLLRDLLVAADLGFVAYQGRDLGTLKNSGFAAESPAAAGLGDLKLSAKYGLLMQSSSGLDLSVQAGVVLPIGNTDAYMAESSVVIEPVVALSRAFGRLRATANVGYRLRADESERTLQQGSELLYRVAGAFSVSEAIALSAGLSGSTSGLTPSSKGPAQNPSEILVGGSYAFSEALVANAGFGFALTQGYGNPLVRGLVSMRWSPIDEAVLRAAEQAAAERAAAEKAAADAKAAEDARIAAEKAAAEKAAADAKALEEQVRLAAEKAAAEAKAAEETRLAAEKAASDAKAADEAARLATEKAAAASKLAVLVEAPVVVDRDGTVIRVENKVVGIEHVDATTSVYQMTQTSLRVGDTVKAGQQIGTTAAAIEIKEAVQFAQESATVLPVSFALLDDVAGIVQAHQEIRKLRVEGHTDKLGSKRENLELSQKRAEAVREHLISKSIDAARLEAVGYGEAHPIASNKTSEGREKNRRVAFTVVR